MECIPYGLMGDTVFASQLAQAVGLASFDQFAMQLGWQF
jgi:hypothetical protein